MLKTDLLSKREIKRSVLVVGVELKLGWTQT